MGKSYTIEGIQALAKLTNPVSLKPVTTAAKITALGAGTPQAATKLQELRQRFAPLVGPAPHYGKIAEFQMKQMAYHPKPAAGMTYSTPQYPTGVPKSGPTLGPAFQQQQQQLAAQAARNK